MELFNLINGIAGQNLFLDYLMIGFTHLGIVVLAIIILMKKDKKLIIKSLLSMTLTFVIDFVINSIYYKPRPFVDHQVNKLINKSASSSFPSGHSMRAFALAQNIYSKDKRLGLLSYFIAAMVAISRIYVGVHYPIDVFIGALIGIFCGWLVERYFSHLERLWSKYARF